jgi:hypothetical protein
VYAEELSNVLKEKKGNILLVPNRVGYFSLSTQQTQKKKESSSLPTMPTHFPSVFK